MRSGWLINCYFKCLSWVWERFFNPSSPTWCGIAQGFDQCSIQMCYCKKAFYSDLFKCHGKLTFFCFPQKKNLFFFWLLLWAGKLWQVDSCSLGLLVWKVGHIFSCISKLLISNVDVCICIWGNKKTLNWISFKF